VGFVVDMHGRRSNQIVRQGLEVVVNLRHRGAKGAEANTGDGAGILLQLPHEFLHAVSETNGLALPGPGDYAVGVIFLPPEDGEAQKIQALIEDAAYRTGQKVLGWRDVPVDSSPLGRTARAAEPRIRHVFLGRGEGTPQEAFERKLLVLRKRVERAVEASSIEGREDFYVASLSSRTIAYKGMLSAEQLEAYFPDLQDPRMTSALALVHQRFSTNTFPSWPLAQPFRYLAHNGEINTLRGNINWMRAREGSEVF
jgi:glutamate synthase (ferredoxin)